MKLLKYECGKMVRPLLPLYAASLAMAGLSRLLLNAQSGLLVTFGGWASFLTMLVLAAAVIVTVLTSWMSFYRNNFKPEAYVMHSLPVSKGKIWLSFVLSGLVFLTLAAGTAILTIRILAPSVIMDTIQSPTGQHPDIVWVILAAAEFQLILDWICGLTGMSLGLKRQGSRLSWSAAWGVLIYLAVILVLVLLALVTAGPEAMFLDETIPPETMITLLKMMTAGYGVMDLLLILLGGFIYSRGFDLE